MIATTFIPRFAALAVISVLFSIAVSCAGKPVTPQEKSLSLTGIWVRTGDPAAGTSILVVQSNGLYYGYLLTVQGVLKNKFFSNECKWMGLTQTGTMEWKGSDLYRLVKPHPPGPQSPMLGSGSNIGYLPCTIVLSDANTLYLQTPVPVVPPLLKEPADFSNIVPSQKWIKAKD